jgi:poly-gamma-glutamate synthesis protein (capsule biosynthesis protein)
MTLGNNHAYDCGRDAILDTIESLRKAGITPIGAGLNFTEAMKPAIFDLAGRKIAVFSFTILSLEGMSWNPDMPTTAFTHETEMTTAIRAVRDTVDKVIVILHWGREYGWLPTGMQKKIAEALSQAGADIIIGHHPHIIEPCTRIGKTWVAYSLGNLVFDSRNVLAKRTALMKIIISGSDGDIRVEFVPLEINRCRPAPASPQMAEWIAQRLRMPDDSIIWRVSGDSILARRYD